MANDTAANNMMDTPPIIDVPAFPRRWYVPVIQGEITRRETKTRILLRVKEPDAETQCLLAMYISDSELLQSQDVELVCHLLAEELYRKWKHRVPI